MLTKPKQDGTRWVAKSIDVEPGLWAQVKSVAPLRGEELREFVDAALRSAVAAFHQASIKQEQPQ